jgi:hypothetical protein
MAGKGQITSKRASLQKIIRLYDADNENKMAGKGHSTSFLQKFATITTTIHPSSVFSLSFQ